MDMTEDGLYRKRTIAGFMTGYDLPASHPLAHLGMRYTDSDGGWHFVFEAYVKPKSFSDAEMSAEYLQGIIYFQEGLDMDELYGYTERSPRTKKACERMHTLSNFLYGIDCGKEGY